MEVDCLTGWGTGCPRRPRLPRFPSPCALCLCGSFVPTGTSAHEDHLPGCGPQGAAVVVAVRRLEGEAGVQEEERQLAGIVDVAFVVADGALGQGFGALELVVEEADSSAL